MTTALHHHYVYPCIHVQAHGICILTMVNLYGRRNATNGSAYGAVVPFFGEVTLATQTDGADNLYAVNVRRHPVMRPLCMHISHDDNKRWQKDTTGVQRSRISNRHRFQKGQPQEKLCHRQSDQAHVPDQENGRAQVGVSTALSQARIWLEIPACH